MILPALVALLVAGGALLRGSWDLWAQTLLHLAVISGLTLWALARIFVGFIPLPSSRTLVWTAALAALSAASAWASPVHGLARPDWGVFLQGLWLFPAMAALSKDERTGIDQAARAAAWVLMMLAVYQHFQATPGNDRPVATLLNQNVYAGAVLLFLPLALERRDWLLALGLVWTLWWTKSVGAWLGLAAALVITQRRSRPVLARAGFVMAAVVAVAIYGKLDTPEVLHRWGWWKAAAAMTVDRPLTGYGPGSFAYVLAGYADLAPYGLYSLYAHQYPLQVLAEYGLPFAVLWFGGLWRCLAREGHYKRFAVIAALVHSFWDYALAIPSNFWLFCYCAASSMPDSPGGVNLSSAYKPPAALLALGLGLALGAVALEPWRAQRLVLAAQQELAAGRLPEARALLAEARPLSHGDPELPLTAAAVELRAAADEPGTGAWLAAASALEEAARLNPYRRSTWTELSLVYRRLGRLDAAQDAQARSERFFRGAGR